MDSHPKTQHLTNIKEINVVKNKSPFVSVAIKARAEQVYLICRAAATKRSAANLKGDLGGM